MSRFLSRCLISDVFHGFGASLDPLMVLLGTCFVIKLCTSVSNEFHMYVLYIAECGASKFFREETKILFDAFPVCSVVVMDCPLCDKGFSVNAQQDAVMVSFG